MGAARNKDAAKTATNGNLAFITYPPYCCETYSNGPRQTRNRGPSAHYRLPIYAPAAHPQSVDIHRIRHDKDFRVYVRIAAAWQILCGARSRQLRGQTADHAQLCLPSTRTVSRNDRFGEGSSVRCMTDFGRVAPVTPSVSRRWCFRLRSSGRRSLRDPQRPVASDCFGEFQEGER